MRLFSKFITFFTLLLLPLGLTFAAQDTQQSPSTYIFRVTSGMPEEQVDFMTSYVHTLNNGEIGHDQIKGTTPWEVEIKANRLFILINALSSDKTLNTSLILKTKNGEKEITSGTGRGSAVIEDAVVGERSTRGI